MADSVSSLSRIKKAWIKRPDKALALDRALDGLADRIEELSDVEGGASLVLTFNINRGLLVEVRLDRNERFS